jgi:hypothetical protein
VTRAEDPGRGKIMNSRLILRLAGCAVVIFLLAGVPALAAMGEWEDTVITDPDDDSDGDSDGGDAAGGTPVDAMIGASWNPTLTCDSPADDTGDLLVCMIATGTSGCGGHPYPTEQEPPGTQIGGEQFPVELEQNPPQSSGGCVVQHHTGNYLVWFVEPAGLEILREDLTEIDRLRIWESFPDITWLEAFVDRPDLVAEIKEIEAVPSSGVITVTLNGWAVSVQTALSNNARQLNRDLLRAIQRAGFRATYEPPYIVVERDFVSFKYGTGLKRVRMESTDPNIVSSEIALEPAESRPTLETDPPSLLR